MGGEPEVADRQDIVPARRGDHPGGVPRADEPQERDRHRRRRRARVGHDVEPARPLLVARHVNLAREREVLLAERLVREVELLVPAVRIGAVLSGERLARIEDEGSGQLLTVHGGDEEAVETAGGGVDVVIAEGGRERHVHLVLGGVGGEEPEPRGETDVVVRHRDRLDEGGVRERARGVRERAQRNDLRVDLVFAPVRVLELHGERARERGDGEHRSETTGEGRAHAHWASVGLIVDVRPWLSDLASHGQRHGQRRHQLHSWGVLVLHDAVGSGRARDTEFRHSRHQPAGLP